MNRFIEQCFIIACIRPWFLFVYLCWGISKTPSREGSIECFKHMQLYIARHKRDFIWAELVGHTKVYNGIISHRKPMKHQVHDHQVVEYCYIQAYHTK